MADVQIELSKAMFKLLVKHVFIGNWIISSNNEEGDKDSEALIDTILSIAKNYNIINEIDYDEHLEGYFLTAEKEEEYLEEIESYTEDSFWETLIERFSFRDFSQKNAETAIKKMEPKDMIEKMAVFEEKYRMEFEEFGIKRLNITG